MQGPSPRFSSFEHLIYDQYPKKCFTQIHRDLYGDGAHPNGHKHGGNQRISRDICYRVLLQKSEFIPPGTHQRKRKTFPNT